MPEIDTFLTFNDQAEEAARFYTSVFREAEIVRTSRYPDLGPEFPFPAGHVMTVDFTICGRRFTALNGGPSFAFSQGISIAVRCDTQDEVDEYWARFAEAGGKPAACGWIADQFGVSWQITPGKLIELITGPDAERAARAMRSMMTMQKIEIDRL